MATQAPPAKATSTRPVSQPLRVPPDENLWLKYSPHGEAPLSFVGSMALHILVIVLLALCGWLAYMFFSPPLKDLPMDTIRMPGGGGGNPNGHGDGPGIGTGGREDVGENKGAVEDRTPEKLPQLDIQEAAAEKKAFANDPDAVRYIEDGNDNLKKLARQLDQQTRDTLRDGINPGQGQGGTGQGGGKGTGKGMGNGSGEGVGAPLSVREKRMLRWSMAFSTRSGHDYLEQLRDLGAVIAVPMVGPGKKYQLCDLSKQPYRWNESDLSNNNKIFWIDDKPSSVQSLVGALGVRGYPSHFIAFMPQSLEERLRQMEHDYKGLEEDQIYETKFDCFRDARTGRYDVKVREQKAK